MISPSSSSDHDPNSLKGSCKSSALMKLKELYWKAICCVLFPMWHTLLISIAFLFCQTAILIFYYRGIFFCVREKEMGHWLSLLRSNPTFNSPVTHKISSLLYKIMDNFYLLLVDKKAVQYYLFFIAFSEKNIMSSTKMSHLYQNLTKFLYYRVSM